MGRWVGNDVKSFHLPILLLEGKRPPLLKLRNEVKSLPAENLYQERQQRQESKRWEHNRLPGPLLLLRIKLNDQHERELGLGLGF